MIKKLHPFLALVSVTISTGAHSKTLSLEERVAKLEQQLFEMKLKKCSDITTEDHQTIGFQCITSTGNIMKRVNRPGYGEAWKTQDGYVWSKNFLYSSNIKNGNERTEAENQCLKLGGTSHLPSKEDYIHFQKNFEIDHFNPTFLSAKGRQDMLGIFTDMNGDWFWTTTPYFCYQECVYDFGGTYGKLSFSVRTKRGGSAVRCVERQ